MKLAQFKNIEHDYTCIDGEELDRISSYVRLSEWVEVEFTKLPYGEAEKKEIESIDKQIETVMAVSEKKINELKQKKDDLLALTN
jgi:hypothetical protein